MRRMLGRLLLVGSAMAWALACPASASDYYAGKRLTVVINFAAGGPADIEGRVVAKHLVKHIAGTPGLVVQNMDGAGGLLGTNYIGEVAAKDGTVLGLLSGAAWQAVGDTKGRKVEFKSYEFVAAFPGTTVYFMRRDVKPGIKSPLDLGKAEGVISGGLGADGSKDILLRLTLDILGHKYKYVTGYRGSAAARLALSQGEINYYAESPPSYRGVVEPGMVAKGEAIGLFYDLDYDGSPYVVPKAVRGLDMLPFPELYKRIRGAYPSGEYWQAYRAVVSLNHALQRLAVVPPGTPQAAVDALRTAFARLADDKDLAEECNKAFGYVPDIVTGADINERVRNRLTTTPEMKAYIARYIEIGAKLK